MSQPQLLRADDLRQAAGLARAALTPALHSDWSTPAADLEWSCRQTLHHITRALDRYALHLATRSTTSLLSHLPGGDQGRSEAELLILVEGRAAILAELVEAAPGGTRAFHSRGLADAEGFVAMGCDEILVHAHDIARALDQSFAPPHDLARRVLGRLFPWAAPGNDAWSALLWSNGRRALPDRPRLASDWSWHCAPLEEWDGTPRTGTIQAG